MPRVPRGAPGIELGDERLGRSGHENLEPARAPHRKQVREIRLLLDPAEVALENTILAAREELLRRPEHDRVGGAAELLGPRAVAPPQRVEQRFFELILGEHGPAERALQLAGKRGLTRTRRAADDDDA